MKAVPAKVMALGLAVLICVGALLLMEGAPERAAAESLQVTTVASATMDGHIALRISWRWDPPAGKRSWRAGEELLAVSFDTRALVWVSEQAPSGTGTEGGVLRKLEAVAGADGARRFFVIPEGEDGHVTLQFQPKYPGAQPVAEPFRVYVAFDHPAANVWMSETAVPGDGLMTAAKQDF